MRAMHIVYVLPSKRDLLVEFDAEADDDGLWYACGLGLGMNRLAILPGKNQAAVDTDLESIAKEERIPFDDLVQEMYEAAQRRVDYVCNEEYFGET